jgi:hypothetical protein
VAGSVIWLPVVCDPADAQRIEFMDAVLAALALD